MNPLLIKGLVALAYLGYLFRKGYRRRRSFWNRRSWQFFSLSLVAALTGFGLGTAMASGVDHGIYAGMSPVAHKLYFYALMILTLASPLVFAGLIVWFGNGKPERPFGFSRNRVRESAV